MRRGLTLGVAACLFLSVGAVASLASGCGSSDAGGNPGDPDAAQPAPDADASDPGLDAGADTTVAKDAGREAAPADQRYCNKLVPKPKFCDDFDDGDLKNDWDVSTVLSGSIIDIDDTMSTSAPFSYVVATPKLTTQVNANASLRKTVVGAVSHVKYSFSAFFPAVTFDKGIIAIATLDVSASHYFTLNLRDDDMTLPAASLQEFVGGSVIRHLLTKVPPINAWTRVVIDLDFGAGKANISFDAAKALDNETITPTPGTEATVRLGAVYMDGPSDAFQANFDDVIVDF